MKNNNTFKRVAAGALAAISVAGYTIPANVGGFLTNTSVLTAGAVDEAAKLDELKLTGANLSDSFTSFKAKIKVDGQLIDEELTERRQIRDFFTLAHNDKLVQGSDVEIKSIVPLNINVGTLGFTAPAGITMDSTTKNFYKSAASDNTYKKENVAANVIGADATSVYYNSKKLDAEPFAPIQLSNSTFERYYKSDGTKATTPENAKFIYQPTDIPSGQAAGWYSIYAVASAQPDTLVDVGGNSFREKVSDADVIFATLWDKTKNQPNVGKDTYIYGLNESEVREVANNSSFDAPKANISVAAPYYTATGRDDTGYTYTFKVPKGANNLSGNAGDAGVISISAATTIVNVDYSDSTEDDIENLKTTWDGAEFPDSAPDKIKITKFEKDANNNEVSVKVIASTTAAGTAITKDGVNITAFQNEKIKIVADQNFGAYYWSGLASAGAEYGVATYDSNVDSDTAGKYVLEINAPYGTGAAPKVVLTALPNVVNYTMGENDTAIFATGSGYSNAAVAELTAKYQESGKTDKTNIAFDGSVPNGTEVELGLNVVPELLKTSSNKTWKATLTRNKGTDTEASVTAEGTSAFVNDVTTPGVTAEQNGTTNWNTVKAALLAKDTGNKKVFKSGKIQGAGKYELALTVYVNEYDSNGVATITPKTIKYNFEIKTKNALTASNVKVVATTAKDVLVDDANTEVSTLSYFANPYGVLQFRASSKFNSDSVQLEGIVYDDTKQTVIGQYSGNIVAGDKNSNQAYNAATQFNVTTGGYDRQNTLNDIETLEIRFLDAEYGADEQVISIPYVITDNAVATVDYIGDEDPANTFSTVNQAGNNPNIKLSMDTIDKLETKIFDTYYVNGIDEDQVVFEYSEGKDKRIDVRELEWREPGLPNAVGNYTVFLTYNGEAFAAVNVEIAEHTMYFVPSEDALNMTFGDKLTFKTDYTPTGVDGKAVKADMPEVQYTIYKPAYDVNGEIMTDEDGVPLVANKTARPAQSERKSPYYVANKAYDTYYTYDKAIGKRGYLPAAGTEDLYYKVKNSAVADLDKEAGVAGATGNADLVKHSPDYNAAKELYNAGVYVVKMSGSVNKNSGYVVEDQYFLVNIDQVEITDKTFVIYPATVQKNNTAGYTVGAGTGAANNAKIEVVKKYADLGLQLSVVSGRTTQSDIGDYDIAIGANAADIASVRNFKGTVPTQWHVIKRATQDSMKGLEFLPKKTALTGDAQIVIRAQRPEDNKLLTGSTADAKVSRVGFVVDTKGKLAAPKYDTVEQYMNMDYTSAKKAPSNHGGDTAIQNAYEALQLNNGFRETNTQDVSKTEFGANIYMPEDTSIGVWLRPYVLLDDGTIYYGDVKYLNITAEATYYLNLKMGDQNNALYNNPGVAAKDNKDVKKDMGVEGKITDTAKKIAFRKAVQSGYHAADDSFFAYGSYTLTSNEIVKASAVKKFGIIADDSGVFAAPTAAEYYGSNTEKVSVKDGLKLRNDNLFATGSAKADNPQYDTDEYGLKLSRKSQKSKVTGIWARGYVDLGDGIVVYTDPVYISSVSDYYTKDATKRPLGAAFEKNVALDITKVKFGDGANKSSKMITLTTNNLNVKGLSSNVAIPQVGLVVDETGSLLTKDANGYKAKVIDGEYAADKRLVLDNGYKQGAFNNKTLQNGKQDFTYMQKPLVDADGDEIPLVIRPFVKLEIYGKEVIIYGKPVTNLKADGTAGNNYATVGGSATNEIRNLDGTVVNASPATPFV